MQQKAAWLPAWEKEQRLPRPGDARPEDRLSAVLFGILYSTIARITLQKVYLALHFSRPLYRHWIRHPAPAIIFRGAGPALNHPQQPIIKCAGGKGLPGHQSPHRTRSTARFHVAPCFLMMRQRFPFIPA